MSESKISDQEALEIAERGQRLLEEKQKKDRDRNRVSTLTVKQARGVLNTQNKVNRRRKVEEILGNFPRGTDSNVIDDIRTDLDDEKPSDSGDSENDSVSEKTDTPETPKELDVKNEKDETPKASEKPKESARKTVSKK
ncbi:hypothetical protein MLD52_09120 [Puniceicoccaceae bacterium K14]|nr:hypothetical protein [Puniceicoccaceae bacterium K14]